MMNWQLDQHTMNLVLVILVGLVLVLQLFDLRILRSSKRLQEKNHRLLSQLLKLALLEQSSIEALNESEHYGDDDDEPDVHLLKDV